MSFEQMCVEFMEQFCRAVALKDDITELIRSNKERTSHFKSL